MVGLHLVDITFITINLTKKIGTSSVKYNHWAQGCNPESASETIGHDVTNLFKHFQLYMTNDLYARKQRMADTIALASVFEKFKYPYVMLNSCSEWLDADLQTDNHPVVGSKYKLMFPWNNFYQPYDSFVSSMIKIYPDNFSHPHGDKIPIRITVTDLQSLLENFILRNNNEQRKRRYERLRAS